jgi:rubrerythrin
MKPFTGFSTREVLVRAISVEAKNAKQFDEWANRFLPYDPQISSLLDGMAQEEIQHQKILEKWFQELFGEAYVEKIQSDDAEEWGEEFNELQEHFFVMNKQMASKILEDVLESEENARQFYEVAAKDAVQLELRELYNILANFEGDHVERVSHHLKEMKHTEELGREESLSLKNISCHEAEKGGIEG